MDSVMANVNRRVLIGELPKGKLAPEHFKLTEAPIPQPKDGEVLLRVLYIIVEPAMRAWMLFPTYRAALKAGDVMACAAIAEIMESRAPEFRPGDIVYTDDS